MKVLVLILTLAVCIWVVMSQGKRREKRIHNKIKSMGGKVITIERSTFLAGTGPFKVVSKGRVVYRVVYTIDGEEKEGWARFGGILGADWRL
ncbi:hypothetical protein [Alkaliphilus hydrothermalis]|uniref:Uncharacterized protein n=1 Tax=Alkaliphilus hydrothermalis TaxID=1482730 RepID=A0ABS2NS88_9FIRM|nr:hypothetical protein [Alkaliphilus hydrothermalis]MBM7615829.1 hypothetical protein [Alkaliphilus hydrothermalis]